MDIREERLAGGYERGRASPATLFVCLYGRRREGYLDSSLLLRELKLYLVRNAVAPYLLRVRFISVVFPATPPLRTYLPVHRDVVFPYAIRSTIDVTIPLVPYGFVPRILYTILLRRELG